MKRLSSVVLLTIVALVSFLGGFYFFFPRDAALSFLWRKGILAAAERGVTLESAALGVEGYFPFRIILRNVRVAAPVASAEAGTATLAPLFVESLLSMAPKAEIRLDRLSLNLPLPGQPPLFLSTFSSKGTFRPSAVTFSDVRTAGDLVIVGDVTVNLLTSRLDEVEMSITGERASLLEYARTLLPLQQESSGAWILRRKGGDNQ